jgi:pimeloyl-ACP methyl ester carboxylesterase
VGVPRPGRVARSRALIRGASLKPWSAMKAIMRLANHLALPRHTPEMDFWRAYFDATIECITPQDLISRLELAVDFDSHYTFAHTDLDQWRGRMLIVETGGDQFFPAAERLALRALYPRAQIHTFEKDAHSGTLVHVQEYAALYRAFLDRASAAEAVGVVL